MRFFSSFAKGSEGVGVILFFVFCKYRYSVRDFIDFLMPGYFNDQHEVLHQWKSSSAVSDEAYLESMRANSRWYKGCLLVRTSEIAEGFRRASYNAEIVRKLIWNLFMDTTGDRLHAGCLKPGVSYPSLTYELFDQFAFSLAKIFLWHQFFF